MAETDVEKLCNAVEKLTREVARLDRDVQSLLKLTHFSARGEHEPHALLLPSQQTLHWALSEIAESARRIRETEYDLNAIRAQISAIADDVVSREEFKRYLK